MSDTIRVGKGNIFLGTINTKSNERFFIVPDLTELDTLVQDSSDTSENPFGHFRDRETFIEFVTWAIHGSESMVESLVYMFNELFKILGDCDWEFSIEYVKFKDFIDESPSEAYIDYLKFIYPLSRK